MKGESVEIVGRNVEKPWICRSSIHACTLYRHPVHSLLFHSLYNPITFSSVSMLLPSAPSFLCHAFSLDLRLPIPSLFQRSYPSYDTPYPLLS